MLITIDVKKHYDWEPMDGEPLDEEIEQLLVKPAGSGKWIRKVLKDQETFTEIAIPEAQIQELMHPKRGPGMRRPAAVAWFLEQVVMPHHAHPEDFVKVHVHDEPGVEKFLNAYFELGE
jgi:hypothetical protein